ncbi:hypothetical protein LSH36_2111g00003 [Paralvinella palmiformis]|uniref:Beta-glucosidase n=1 Tax=Paralvinella palmiformis TaxID=53620 RepID=A0AAD9MQB1_9ANNE|nr:hypothetical protein LSH36_2111g00003 [Paralvinella palmiformis]
MVHSNTDNNNQEENIPIKELKTIFPDAFLWGISTSSYQVEGAVNADKRGRSIWDTFSHTPGKTANGATGDTTCDQYHRYEEDIALMRTLGVKVYNFSIAWPRIYPEGKGQINIKGIDYYRRLIEALQRNKIQPVITLYHWDLPQSLQDLGGWELRDTAKYFSDYAQSCYQHLAQYIPLWCTLNEPWCDAFLGHLYGIHAPGKQNRQSAYSSTHHLLYAHGLAVQAFRDGAYPGKIGIKLNLETPKPASNSLEDRQAADRGADEPSRLFLNPLFAKAYPGRLLKAYPQITIPLKKNDEKISTKPPWDGILPHWDY